jgi:hypothetical protein
VVRVRRLVRNVLRRGWRAAHRVAPALTERIDDKRRARLRSTAAVAGIVRFEERIAALERDLDLVSKQLAVLAMRLEHPSADDAPTVDEQRLVTARMSAIAFYEERISRLEAAAGVGEAVSPDSPR